jgi:hypothetical protein
VTERGKPSLLMPIGLIHLGEVFDITKMKAPPMEAADSYLGFHFIVESPLSEQSFTVPDACVSRWVLALPPEGSNGSETDLGQAMQQLKGGKLAAWQEQNLTEPLDGLVPLGKWLTAEVEEKTPLALVVLSHHDPDKGNLFYDDNGPRIPVSVSRWFDEGSLVILDGCRTGLAGLWGFSDAFNRHGVSAAIVSGTDVPPSLAGDFLVCLGDSVSGGSADVPIPLSEVFYKTLLCVRGKGSATALNGPGALAYILLGNGNLRLCAPSKENG